MYKNSCCCEDARLCPLSNPCPSLLSQSSSQRTLPWDAHPQRILPRCKCKMRLWSIVRRKLLRGSTHAESVTPSTSTSSSSRASAASCLPPPSHFERVSAVFIDISFLLIYSHKPLQMSLLLQLPTELLVKIISSLDWRTLLACRKVGFLLTPSCTTDFRSIH